ncbi:MAG: hypothetical protein KDD60_00555 [Bdellovibrionales bacterium]|nr:hypothetical protein [Bdellovibrionales bacterium]
MYSGSSDSGEDLKPNVLSEIIDSERGYARGPERVLLSAILFDGIQAYMTYAMAESEEQKKRYHEAYRWVHRESEDYVFSFENVCEGLGIDPDYLRFGLANVIHSDDGEWKRSRRNF